MKWILIPIFFQITGFGTYKIMDMPMTGARRFDTEAECQRAALKWYIDEYEKFGEGAAASGPLDVFYTFVCQEERPLTGKERDEVNSWIHRP